MKIEYIVPTCKFVAVTEDELLTASLNLNETGGTGTPSEDDADDDALSNGFDNSVWDE
ncbi:MAG: hypothetical protein IJ640_02350 [Prevotella sp.]|nr:hypothetical protein [Prevotella sp.]